MTVASVVGAVFKTIEAILAVIGGLVVAGLAYLWFADPLNLKPLLLRGPAAATTTAQHADEPQPIGSRSGTVAAPKPTAPAPTLTPEQQAAAARLGIDPSSLAAQLTPQVEACAVASLGQARVDEIKAGSSPTPLDLVRAGHCLSR